MKLDEANRNALALAVFARGGSEFDVADILDAAWFRGDLQPTWEEFQAGERCVERASDAGLEPDTTALQALSEDVRYQLDLITAEETEAWLAARQLSLDDFTDHFIRVYWRRHFTSETPRPGLDYALAPLDVRQTYARQLWFTGKLTQLARALAWRVADDVAPEGQVLMPTTPESVRAAFMARTGTGADSLPAVLQKISRDLTWFETTVAREEHFNATSAQLRTSENRLRRLAALRLPLTQFEIEVMDLESEDAAREACLCLEADGLSMEEVAAQEHYRVERRQVLLEDFAEELQPRLLGAEVGQVRHLTTADQRHQVCRIVSKSEPTLADERTRQRVDAELLSSHFDHLVAKHIVWLLP